MLDTTPVLISVVLGHIRYGRLQTFLIVLAIAAEVTLILVLVGIRHGMASHPDLVRNLVGGLAVKVLWLVFGVSFLCVTISRYAAVSERTQEIGILKMLGASSSYIFNLLFQETLVIAVPGTVWGIAMACGTKWLIAYAFPDFLMQETVYKWWPIAGAISAVSALLGAFLAARKAVRQDVIKALSYEELAS